jgi:hypothetical protein
MEEVLAALLGMDTAAAPTLDRLRENATDPKRVEIELSVFPDDEELSKALQDNEHVNSITLDLSELVDSNHATNNWDSLLHVLATRENFERFELEDVYEPDERNPPERVAPFLLAVQGNPRLHTVRFTNLRISSDSVGTFLNTAASVTDLELIHCSMEGPGGALAVANALQRNTSIRRLKLHCLDDDILSILTGLTSNTSVEELTLWWFQSLSRNVSRAVQRLLESTTTTTIQSFCFWGVGVTTISADVFRPIAHGLLQRTSVRNVRFTS